MNTLPRAITAQVLADPNTFHRLRQHWSGLMRSPRRHELRAVHHLLYLALLGKDWRRGFALASSRRKLENGAFENWAMFRATAALHMISREYALLAPFDGLVTPDMLKRIRQMLSVQQATSYRAEQFAAGFPFDAYNLPAEVRAFEPGDGETHA